MSLRQREWAIFTRPYYQAGTTGRKYYTDRSVDGYIDGRKGRAGLGGANRGYTEGKTIDVEDNGAWVHWASTGSFKYLRELYRVLLEDTPKEYIKIVEIVNVDTLITPIS